MMRAAMRLQLFGWMIFCAVLHKGIAAVPADNPVAAKYGNNAYPWSAEIRWANVVDISVYSGATMIERFNKARDALVAAGGGVLFFPAGTYEFEDTIYLKSGVMLRGEAPSQSDAKTDGFASPSKLVFPRYVASLSGNGAPDSSAFKCVLTADPDSDCNIGLVNLDINRAAIKFSANPDSGRNRNIVLFGVRSNNVALPDPGVPHDYQNAWQRFSYRHCFNFYVHAYENVLVANCRINDNPTDNFDQPGYLIKMSDGSVKSFAVAFSYTNHYAVKVNRSVNHDRSDWHVNPVSQPGIFRRGIVIRDNWIYKTMRVGIIAGGYGLVVRDNIIRDQSGKATWTDPAGSKEAKGHQTFENRGIDWSGWNVSITGNDYQVYRHKIGNSGYYSTDGEGIMIQECCGGSSVNGATIGNNTGNAYIGIYKIPFIKNLAISNNSITSNIMVSAEKNNVGGRMYDVTVSQNQTSGGISALASLGGANNIVSQNTCTASGSIRASCHVTVENNTGYSVEQCETSRAANVLPTIQITAPAENATLDSGAITVQAQAEDADGSVDSVLFYEGARLIGSVSSAPYETKWSPTADGLHYLTARAVDNDGGAAVAHPVTVIFGNASGAGSAMLLSKMPFRHEMARAMSSDGIIRIRAERPLLVEIFDARGRTMLMTRHNARKKRTVIHSEQSGVCIIRIGDSNCRIVDKFAVVR
jgi:hypothetical protein